MERLDPEMRELGERLLAAGANLQEKAELETSFKKREELLAGVYHQVLGRDVLKLKTKFF